MSIFPPALEHPTLEQLAQWLADGKPRQVLEEARTVSGAEGLAVAAALRLGDTATALTLLEALPLGARRAVLQARALWLSGEVALPGLQQARTLARHEGDGPALVAAVTLLAEQQLLAGQERFVPLHTLAEGLKVSELMGQAADPHLLAVLAAAQAACTPEKPRKAAQSARKALERAQNGSPAQVGVLLLLGQEAQAEQQRQAGELDSRWLRVFAKVGGMAQLPTI